MSLGVYCLCICVRSSLILEVGALGFIEIIEGRYIYVGSAMNNLEARVKRHLRTSRGIQQITHWHIDYLLKEEEVTLADAYVKKTRKRMECELASTISLRGNAVPKFGSSDCRCDSHLFRVKDWHFLLELGLNKIDFEKFL
jgi:Uri superfamily endonuclease